VTNGIGTWPQAKGTESSVNRSWQMQRGIMQMCLWLRI